MPDLSQNEHLVLPLFADGKKPSNREIADRFGWSMGKVAGVCHRMQLKNLISPRKPKRDLQFIRERPIKKVVGCQYIQGEPPKPWNTDEIKCGKPATNGAYCSRHYSKCYDRKRTAQWS